MSSAPLAAPATAARPLVSPWIVAAAVVIPTFMEVLDTTIANVALRYIAGGLSAPVSDGEWVITSYLAANAIILPISGWLGTRLGRRNYFLMSIAMFTLASALCGIATSLGELIAFRVLQGLAGGGLQPVSQGILLDAFPKEKQGTAMTLFATAALIAPVIGPTLGGYITDNIGWRWIFIINVPVGLLALGMCYAVVSDPDYLKQQQRELRGRHNFDAIGLSLLVIAMVSWEIWLSKGQEWDWFGDPFHRIHWLFTLFAGSLVTLIWWELRNPSPLIDFRTLKDQNFRAACLIIFCAFGVLYANTTTLPGLLQSLFGYDATTSGLVLSPAGIFSVMVLFIVGGLMGRGIDARYFIGIGLVVVGLGNSWMAGMNLDLSPWHVIWPRVVVICGLSMIFAPLNVAAFQNISNAQRGAAVGLLALLRNEGGSVGTSLAKAFFERRDQFHTLRLNENLDPFNPALTDLLKQGKEFFLQQTGDPRLSELMTVNVFQQVRAQQAAALAYFDIFWALGVLALFLAPLIFLMRPSVAEKGAHIAAE